VNPATCRGEAVDAVAEPDELPERFARTWNDADADGIAALFTADADFSFGACGQVSGRSAADPLARVLEALGELVISVVILSFPVAASPRN
jgi:cell division GTPase FtsZ